MATVIDALLITLNLDPSGFKKGTKETDEALKKTAAASTKTSKEMESWGKNAAGSLSKLRNEALGLLAVFTAGMGIKNFVESTITSASSLGRLSANLNMSAKDVAEWQLANKNAGGTVEGMTAQLEAAAHAVTAYRNGVADAETTNAFFYGDMHDEDMKSVETYMAAKSRILSKLKDDPLQQLFVAGQINVGKDVFNLMKQTEDEVARLRASFAKLADEQAKASIPMEAFRKKLDALKDNFQAVGVKILTALMPQFERLANWVEANQDGIEAWANKAVVAIEEFVTWVDNAAKSMGGWENVLIALVAIQVASFVAPIVSMAAALVSLAGGLTAVGLAGPAALAVLTGAAGYLFGHGLNNLIGMGLTKLNDGKETTLGTWAYDKLHPDEGKGSREVRGKITDGTARPNAATASPVLFSNLEKKYGLDDGLLDSMWQQESGRGKNMRSKAGAKGHFQFMDATAKQYGLTDPDDLAQSADAAARMMRDLKKQNGGSLPKALAAYNWGQGNLDKKGIDAAPAETKNYAPQVQARMAANKSNNPSAPNYLTGDSRVANNSGTSNTVNMVQAAQAPARAANNNSTSTSSSETNINGPITINTQATDAKGIARDLGKVIASSSLAAQANTGLA